MSSTNHGDTSPKSNDTLVEDIYAVFEKNVEVTPEQAKSFGETLARIIVDKLRPQTRNYLRLSNLGSVCRRKLWYSIRTPSLGEKLSGPARIKFLIGDITEAVVLFLAKLAGHDVSNEQQTVSLHGVEGHIDAEINGEVTDVKSASPFSFKKFEEGLRPDTDAFGYLTQLGSYAQAKGKRGGNFLAVNKVLGHLHLDRHRNLPDVSSATVEEVRAALDSHDPPDRGFDDIPEGKSGNRKLSLPCSYCEFKTVCWPGVKQYNYSKGPVFLTKVVNEPRVPSTE